MAWFDWIDDHVLWLAGPVGFAVTYYFVRRVMKQVLAQNVLDIPTDRSMHTTPTPRGGGLAIVAGFFICAFLYSSFNPWAFKFVLPVFLGGVPIAWIGWRDDRGHVHPKWRALLHVGACGFAFLTFYALSFHGEPTPVVWLAGVTLACAYFLNLYNFMDGLDGLAASEAVFGGLAGAYISVRHNYIEETARPMTDFFAPPMGLPESVAGILGGLLGICSLAFLLWNWPPAKLFMGDVGSGFLGFAFGFFALANTISTPRMIWMWLILFGVFIVDGTYTLAARFFTRQKWYEAHRLHAFQKIALTVNSHRTVTLSAMAINIVWLLPLAYYAAFQPELGPWLTAAAYGPLIAIVARVRAGINESSPADSSTVAK